MNNNDIMAINYLCDPEEYYSREIEPLGEMATTYASSDKPKLRIQVNPDRTRIGVPYFKVFNDAGFTSATKVARLHFLDTGMEYHRDKFKDWILTNKEVKMIKKVLNSIHKKEDSHTVWEWTCWMWNYEYAVFYNDKLCIDEDEYFEGKYDKDPDFYNHPSYVPSTTPIPDTWIYNPKNK